MKENMSSDMIIKLLGEEWYENMERIIKKYPLGANISLLNVMYHKPVKNPDTGRYGKGSLDIIYKDLDTGKKHVEHIKDPDYEFYMTNDDVQVTTNQLFIEKEKVHPIVCKYSDIKKVIAEMTGNLDFFYDNIRNGNYRENDQLFYIPRIFNADMNIEDHYRYLFNKQYKNTPFIPTNNYIDIEVDGIHQKGDFPEMGECPVNAITLIFEKENRSYTLLLENPENPLIEEFKNTPNLGKEIKDFIRENIGGWKNEIRFNLDKMEYQFAFYDDEIKLIQDAFGLINYYEPDFSMAWNMAFDIPYLIERIKRIGYNPEDIVCHNDFKLKEAWYFTDTRADKFEERGDYAQVSAKTIYVDQLITFASRRKGQRAYQNFKLDYIAGAVTKGAIRKLDYSHITRNIAKLPYLNYKVFVFYNVMDVVAQKCIEHKTGDVGFLYNKCMMNNTRYAKAHRQTVYLANRAIKEFWDMGFVMGNNVNKNNPKIPFPGAFVADPKLVSDKPKRRINGKPVNICDNLDDYDYARLYPSELDKHNMAPNTMIGKILIDEPIDPNENRFNNDYFDRVVALIEDFLSGNYIDFGKRYLNLAGYEEMYDDIIEYFSKIKNPSRPLLNRDTITGLLYMASTINNKEKRIMAHKVDNTKLRNMVRTEKRMVNLDDWAKNQKH